MQRKTKGTGMLVLWGLGLGTEGRFHEYSQRRRKCGGVEVRVEFHQIETGGPHLRFLLRDI